ncbi:MAG: mannose-1-phosphate guanylyltransferase/mannose-6-phosphate isomerase [Alphaproteobacteria bacterium RIFCSPHIGHO2_02_FULL_46_13]|nr:MAG: mannose-1-phosphate guanylyltransferase/mannose-6-phosphate isomerase [Alphaproteobacteria bacterium RIFCSPHIGHO2_02_FULL_46_13]
MIPVILSGGSGSRLWPLSRTQYPKQFIALHNNHTLYQNTLLRLSSIGTSPAIVVCNEDHRFVVAESTRELGLHWNKIILEPFGRNTAPAIAIAALTALQSYGDDCILLILPADHIIENEAAFADAVKLAERAAIADKIVTFGVKPTEAHTGYGNIQIGQEVDSKIHAIQSFKEKPNQETAEKYLSSGNYLWNGGMFAFKASVFIEELQKYHPEILETARKAFDNAKSDLDFLRLDKKEFEKCPDISIDYAVMEHTDKGVVVMLDAKWSDVGAWDSVWQVSDKDENGNVCKGDILTFDTSDSYIYAGNKLVTVLGLKDVIVIDTQDAILVANKSNVQDIKRIVDAIKSKDRSEYKHHRTVFRPWGHYDSICVGERDQVKRITVKPGAKLSLQKHAHRSEHWVVVKGTARVTKGEEVFILSENESVYLPVGIVHALENPTDAPLEIIEVQTGTYLGEDDIIRLQDIYGRV